MAHLFEKLRGLFAPNNSNASNIVVPTESATYYYPDMFPGRYRSDYNFNFSPDADFGIGDATRARLVQHSKKYFTQSGNIQSAIRQISSRGFGRGWELQYNNSDSRLQKWGEHICEWFNDDYTNVCNVKGRPYDFKKTLAVICAYIYVIGEALIIKRINADGFPQLRLLDSRRIGQRDPNETVIKKGSYSGLIIKDGIVYNKDQRAVAYRILGDTPEEDTYISAMNCWYIFDPLCSLDNRGIPRLSPALLNCNDKQFIMDLYKEVLIDEAHNLTLIHNMSGTNTGYDPTKYNSAGKLDKDNLNKTSYDIKQMGRGVRNYIAYNKGDMKSFQTDRPHPNQLEMLKRIDVEILNALDWPYDLLIGTADNASAGMRTVINKANHTLKSNNDLIEPYAKDFAIWAIAMAQKINLVPDMSDLEWWRGFSFTKGPELTIDEGYDRENDRKDNLGGYKTKSQIFAKYGWTYKQVMDRLDKESDDLIDRAKKKANEKQIPFNLALDLLAQRTPNGSSQNAPTPASGSIA